MKVRLAIFFLLATLTANSQTNLLANGSFEIQTACPTDYFQISNATGWNSPNYHCYFSYLCIAPTLLDSCATQVTLNVPDNPGCGGQTQDGHGYAEFYTINHFYDSLGLSFKMYLQSEISSPLKPATYYCFKMYIKCDCVMQWATNDFSVYFSQNKLEDTLSLALDYINPQITNTTGEFYTNEHVWKEYTGYFKADGGEQYLTIGSFLPIDSTPKQPISGQFDAALYYIDNVQLYECDSLNSVQENTVNNRVKLYPNPTAGFMNVEITGQLTNARIELYDAVGKLVYAAPITDNKAMVNLPVAINGIYMVRIINNNSIVKRDRLVIFK